MCADSASKIQYFVQILDKFMEVQIIGLLMCIIGDEEILPYKKRQSIRPAAFRNSPLTRLYNFFYPRP